MTVIKDDPTVKYHLGIATVSLDLLTELFHLPEGHKIKGVRACERSSEHEFEMLIEGPSLPMSSAFQITPHVQITHHLELGEPEPSRKVTATITPILPHDDVEPAWLRKAGTEQPA